MFKIILAIGIILSVSACKKSETSNPSATATPTQPAAPAYSFLVNGGIFVNTSFLKGALAEFDKTASPTILEIQGEDTITSGSYRYAYQVLVFVFSPSTGTFANFQNNDNVEFNSWSQDPSISSQWTNTTAYGAPGTSMVINITQYSSNTVTGSFSIDPQNGDPTITGTFFLPIN